MKGKKQIKKMIIGIGMVAVLAMLNTGTVQAGLQSNSSTQYLYNSKKIVNDWVKAIRTMEEDGGAMGLQEKLNSDYTSETSNNIDVHFMRTTEYGAIAILSASDYGNSSNDQVITSTTGNNTGMIINTNYWEWTAGMSGVMAIANSKYYDQYTNDIKSVKIGDALVECNKWHKALYNDWKNNNNYYLRRGNYGIFSFQLAESRAGISNAGYDHFGRGVAVCGEGL